MTGRGELATLWQGDTPGTWRDRWRVPSVHVFRTTSSTNDVAMRLAEDGAPAGTTVIAETQTAGRGQRGARWSDAAGRSLLLSVVFRTDQAVDPSTMPIRIGNAVAEAVEAETAVRVLLKWPNDLVIPGRGKLGGILCEGASGSRSQWIVAGIGLNVAQVAADLAGLVEPAVSLRMCGADADLAALAGSVLRTLAPFEVQPPPIDHDTLQSIQARDALLGSQVSIDGSLKGTAAGIDATGRLLVRAGGRIERVLSGPVRPMPIDRGTIAPAGDESAPDLRLQSEAPR